MTDIEKQILEKIKEGLPKVPQENLGYLIGFAECHSRWHPAQRRRRRSDGYE